MPEPYGIETAGSFGTGNTYIIVSVGTTDFTLIGASANRPGIVFEATGSGSGTGTARRLNSQLGRIGGKLLADNLLRNGVDLAVKNTVYDTSVLYLKINPEIKETVTAGSFILGIKYRIRTIGTTNYLLWGSLSNTVGTIFTATGPGAGTGTVDRVTDSLTDTDAADALDPISNQGSGSGIGFNTDTPAFDLHVVLNTRGTNLVVSNDATIDNLTVENNRISTSVGPIDIYATGKDTVALFDRITTQYLILNENTIQSISNQNIRINPSGTGTVELTSTTNIDGDLNVTGNITITGNLSKQGNLIIGDDIIDGEGALPENDKVDFNVAISQDLLPGQNNAYDLGGSLGDSTAGRWANAYSPDWLNIQNILPRSSLISDQLRLGDSGLDNVIQAVQSNDNLIIDPDTGLIYIEDLKFSAPFYLHKTIDNPNFNGTPAADNFPTSLAMSDSYILAAAYLEDDGANSESGVAYIFSADTGELLHTLVNPNTYGTTAFDRFGYAVDISETYSIVSAPYEDQSSSRSQVGKVYIFDNATGTLVRTLSNPNSYSTSSSDTFGYAVAINENYAVASAIGEGPGYYSGTVYVFDPDTGSLLRTITNPNITGTADSDNFGSHLAIWGDILVASAWFEDSPNPTIGVDSGIIYVFDLTTGDLLYYLDNPNPYGTGYVDYFSRSIGVCESYIVAGAGGEDTASYSDTGKVYIYDRLTGTLLRTIENPNAYGTPSGDNFGRGSLKISEDLLVVGAGFEDDSGGTNSGKVYIFNPRTGTLLQTLDNPNAYSISFGDNFGLSTIAISESGIAIGAGGEDEATGSSSGKLYFYKPEGTITNLLSTPVKISTTGTGYYRFEGTNAMLIPAGSDATRPVSPELGDTRWNTDRGILECFDGTVYVVSTGAGIEVTEEIMEDLGHVYTLMLG